MSWILKRHFEHGDDGIAHSVLQIETMDGKPIVHDQYGISEEHMIIMASAPDLLVELEAAHVIIHNALQLMTIDQKKKWGEANDRDGVKDGWAVTRHHKREKVIACAKGIEPYRKKETT